MKYMDFINKDFVYVVVGVSEDKSKWGYRVWKQMKLSGYKAIPVNPKYNQIDGEKCYQSISSYFTPGVFSAESRFTPGVDKIVVVTVVPPVVTEKVVEECIKLGITKIWMQEGSESDKALKRISAKNITAISNKCIVRDGLGKAFRV